MQSRYALSPFPAVNSQAFPAAVATIWNARLDNTVSASSIHSTHSGNNWKLFRSSDHPAVSALAGHRTSLDYFITVKKRVTHWLTSTITAQSVCLIEPAGTTTTVLNSVGATTLTKSYHLIVGRRLGINWVIYQGTNRMQLKRWKLAIVSDSVTAATSLKSHHLIIGRRPGVVRVFSRRTNRLQIGRVAHRGAWNGSHRSVARLEGDVLAVDGGAGRRRSRAGVGDGVWAFAATSRTAVVDVNRHADESDNEDEHSDEADNGVHHVPNGLQQNVRWNRITTVSEKVRFNALRDTYWVNSGTIFTGYTVEPTVSKQWRMQWSLKI